MKTKTSFVLFVAIFALFCNSPIMAQNEISFDEFAEQAMPLVSQFNELAESGEYQTAEKLFPEIMVLFYQMSKENQEQHKEIAAFGYFSLAYILSKQDRTTEAVDAFEKAVKVYQFNTYSLARSELSNLNDDERFIELLESIHGVADERDNLTILRDSRGFQSGDTTRLPRFTYEEATSRNLRNVRQRFNLDSIAGQGDDVSQIINLMAFVSQIPHDGSNFALSEFTSIDLYNYHRATGRGLNCRHLAIMLNEIYLAMGFKSTFITCMPKADVSDAHVINSVFSPSLNKWLFMDPSFNTYVKDENGNLLSIEEVRERLIDGRPLVLNEGANHNGRQTFKEWYLYVYMARWLYWFQRPVNSKFNVESRYRDTEQHYVTLIPVGYERSSFFVRQDRNTITHDAAYFWER